MGKNPVIPLYASDFYVDTNSWSVDEVGIYQRLLLTEWVNGGLPNEIKRLARIAGCSAKKFQKGWTTISFKFHLNGSNKLINDRMEEIRESQKKHKELQRQKGKMGAEKRWKEHIAGTIAQPMPEPQPKDSLSFSFSSSITKDNLKRSEAALPDIPDYSLVKLFEEIENISGELYESKIFREVYAFKNTAAKKKINPRTILHTLLRVKEKKPTEPWGYCTQILKVEDGNYNEKDFVKES